MKKQFDSGLRESDSALEELDTIEYFRLLKRHWKIYLVVGFLAAIVAFNHFRRTLPPAESHLFLEFGMNSINERKYPDGAFFNKNDLISRSVVNETFKATSELANSKTWSAEELGGYLSVEGIYPIELQLVRDQMNAKNNTLKPEEMASNHYRLMTYVPLQYELALTPARPLPEKLRGRILTQLVEEYSKSVIKEHINFLFRDDEDSNVKIDSVSPSVALDYFEKKAGQANEWLSFINEQEGSSDNPLDEGNGGGEKDLHRNLPLVGQGFAIQAGMATIREELAILEGLIYEQHGVKDAEGLKQATLVRLEELTLKGQFLEKQTDFRLHLVKLPLLGPQTSNLPGRVSPESGVNPPPPTSHEHASQL